VVINAITTPFLQKHGGQRKVVEMFFKNRTDAGERLSKTIGALGKDFTGWDVVGIARGGVIVAAPIAENLGLPLSSISIDDFELPKSILAVTSFGSGVIFWDDYEKHPIIIDDLNSLKDPELTEFFAKLLAKHIRFNGGKPQLGARVILVDDGLVSGRSIFTAVAALKQQGVLEIAVAIPVVPPWFVNQTRNFDVIAWRVTKMKNPTTGIFYFSFADTPDEDVVDAIKKNRELVAAV
jgi:putative phosphoribosyl transferase